VFLVVIVIVVLYNIGGCYYRNNCGMGWCQRRRNLSFMFQAHFFLTYSERTAAEGRSYTYI
jgi:hypothetical protein